jgi:Sulfotransferase family
VIPGLLRSAALQVRTAQRLARLPRASVRAGLGAQDERLVFVVGSPRSGTTFLAGAIASLPGFVDLGEVAAFKAAIPELKGVSVDEASRRIRRILSVARRLGLVGALRGVEQTPEAAFVVQAAAHAFPQALFVHAIRDGRDVVCSLLERGWLSKGRSGRDDAGLRYGSAPRFWVEPERAAEFAAASDARRAAWAWRRYLTAVSATPAERLHEVRYEQLSADSEGVARDLAAFLAAPAETLADALRAAHGTSVGRWSRELTEEQVADIGAESGALLEQLGYLRIA